MEHIRPYPVSGTEVIAVLGGEWLCPYCKSESPTVGEEDITWVPVPIHSSPKRFMCLGCCDDIYSTCASVDFDDHPYKILVAAAAESEGLSVNEFRLLCLRQQIDAGRMRITQEHDAERYRARLARLESLHGALQ